MVYGRGLLKPDVARVLGAAHQGQDRPAVGRWSGRRGRRSFEGHSQGSLGCGVRRTCKIAGGRRTDDKTALALWDARSGATLSTLEGHSGFSAASRDPLAGRQDAGVGIKDKTVRLWDARSGRRCRRSRARRLDGVSAVAFSADGKTLTSASTDTTVRLWDARSVLRRCRTLEGHSNYVLGRSLLTGRARRWRRHQWTGPSGCGTPGRARRCRRSRASL